MKILASILLIFGSIILSPILSAQYDKVEKSFTHKYYGVREGLGAIQVFDSFQDSRGYIWFKTTEAISRFDGLEFKNFEKGKGVFTNHIVRKIYEHNDMMIFMFMTHLILLYPNDSTEYYPYPSDIYPQHAACQTDENLYIFNCIVDEENRDNDEYTYLVFNFDTKEFKQSSYVLPKIYAAYSSDDKIMAITEKGDVFQLKDEDYLLRQQIGLGDILDFHSDNTKQKDFVFYSTRNDKVDYHIYTINGDTLVLTSTITLPYINFQTHYIYPLTNNRFYIFDRYDKKSYIYENGNLTYFPVSTSIVNSAMLDSESNLWLSTEDGIYNCFKMSFESYKLGYGRNDNIWDIQQDYQGNMWFISYSYGFTKMTPSGNLYQFANTPKNNLIYGYMGGCTDASGRVYLNYNGGIAVIALDKGGVPYFLENGVSLYSYYDSINNKVFASSTIGMVEIDSALNSKNYFFDKFHIVAICRDARNVLRIGTFFGSAYLDENEEKILHDTIPRSYSGLFSMALDSKGILWKGTNAGVYAEYPDGKDSIISLNGKINFVINYKERYIICGLIKGELGILDLRQYHKNGDKTMRIFSHYQGFDVLESPQNGASIDKDGFVWVATGESALRFHPDTLMAAKLRKTPPPFISAIYAKDRESNWRFHNPAQTINLQSDDNFLRFEILQAMPSMPERLQFRYRLKNYSGEWIYDNQRSIVFQNLPPNHYQIEIQSSVDGDEWSESTFSHEITIMPPFWRSLVGILIIIAITVFLLLWLMHYVKVKITKQQEEKRFIDLLKYRAVHSKYIPHFTGNVLNSINYFIQKDKDLAQTYIAKFSYFSQQTLLNSERLSRTIAEELDFTQLYLELEKIRFEDKLEFSIHIDDSVDDAKLVPAMMLQTFCENALKHGLRHKSGVGIIKVKILDSGQYFAMTVEDNGIGREKAKELKTGGTGEGLAIIKQQLDLFNKENNQKAYMNIVDLRTTDNQAAGTRSEVYFPKKYVMPEGEKN